MPLILQAMQVVVARSRRLWVVAAILCGMGACRTPAAPVYYGFQDLQVIQSAGAPTSMAAVVKLYNPNPYSLQLRRAEVDVSINGAHAGHSLLDSTIIIPRKDTFYVPVNLQVDLKAILRNALQTFLSKEATISLDGRVKIKRGMLTFNRSFHYDGKQDIRALLQNGMGF